MSDHWFPLERALEIRSHDHKDECPDHRIELFDRYKTILTYLRTSVYPLVDAGLAANSAGNGFYTLHDSKHFDEVVKYAGELIGCSSAAPEKVQLNAYELFILLVAIRIHDAGNAFGRELHERRAYQILNNMGDAVFEDDTEKKCISDIAQAHGGTAPNGTKDTIGELKLKSAYMMVPFRPQVLAAILRFADEICENRTRAANVILANSTLLEKNEVFHKYAAAITSVTVGATGSMHEGQVIDRGVSDEVNLQFNLNKNDCLKKWGKTEKNVFKEVYLIDEIGERLDKMFRERIYCNKFVRGVHNVVQVTAEITVWDDVVTDGIPHREEAWSKLVRSEEEGYPSAVRPIRERYDLSGESLIEELSQ